MIRHTLTCMLGFKMFCDTMKYLLTHKKRAAYMILNNVLAGVGISFGYLGLVAVSNGLATYVLNGKTLDEFVASRGL